MSRLPERKVHIVDDDEAIRDSLGMLLETQGFDITAYPSGPDFLEAFEPGWRGCLLADLRMPRMDGLELQRALNARGSLLAVIIMTAHGDVPIAVKAMKAGAVDFLEKPIDTAALMAALRRGFDSAPERPGAAAKPDDPELGERFSQLTAREREVLERLVAGRPNKIIAHELDISPRTVELHRARVMQKMEAQSLSHLVRMALSLGIDSA